VATTVRDKFQIPRDLNLQIPLCKSRASLSALAERWRIGSLVPKKPFLVSDFHPCSSCSEAYHGWEWDTCLFVSKEIKKVWQHWKIWCPIKYLAMQSMIIYASNS